MNNRFPFRDACKQCATEDWRLHHHKGYWSKSIVHVTNKYCECLDIQAPEFVRKPGEEAR